MRIASGLIVCFVLVTVGSMAGEKLTRGRISRTISNMDMVLEDVLNDLEKGDEKTAKDKLLLLRLRRFDLESSEDMISLKDALDTISKK